MIKEQINKKLRKKTFNRRRRNRGSHKLKSKAKKLSHKLKSKVKKLSHKMSRKDKARSLRLINPNMNKLKANRLSKETISSD